MEGVEGRHIPQRKPSTLCCTPALRFDPSGQHRSSVSSRDNSPRVTCSPLVYRDDKRGSVASGCDLGDRDPNGTGMR